MKQNIIALIAGIIFGVGLCVSEMVNPQVVLAFLDVTGAWDARLLFVMVGALFVTSVGFYAFSKRKAPFCAQEFSTPTSKGVDKKLIMGAILFGVGWGIAGVCPGPAITALAFGMKEAMIFAVSMLVGMAIFEFGFQSKC